MARGTGKHTYQQLQDELDKLKITLMPGGLVGEASFSVQCARETLPRALELLGEVLRAPAFPQSEFDVLKRQLTARQTRGLTDPHALSQRALQRKLSPYPPEDVRYVPTVQESMERLAKVTLADVRKVYAEQLGATAGEVVVVGDFDPEPTTRQIADMLRDWKAATPYQRVERPAQTEVKGETIVIETPDKANAVYVAGLTVPMTDAHPDYAALEVGNYVLGGAPLASRLSNRVRGKEGFSYNIGSAYDADAEDNRGRFLLFAICNPANIDKVHAAAAEELQKFLKEGVSEKELEEAKKAYLESLKGERATDGALASLLQENLHVGRTTAYQADFEKQVAALTPQKVNDAVRRHIDPKRLVIIEAGDFKKK
jgi:zinc protease